MLCLSVLFLATLSLITNATAATGLGGTITTTTWTKANSPYRITGAATVPSGNTLTIEPGVDVLFDDDVPFVVQGRLQAVGTATDSIRFIKGSTVRWAGLTLSEGDTSTLSYVRISHISNTSLGLNVTTSARLGITNCTISGNTASYGGGLSTYSSTVTLANCTITGNSAYYGGGLYAGNKSTVTLTNCTITGNSGWYGAGLYADGSTVTLKNTILWGNGAQEYYNVNKAITAITATYSDIYNEVPVAFPGLGNINANPLFVNSANGDYRLQVGSPCIDTGDPSLPKDLDGTRADMGAFPYSHPVAVLEALEPFAFVLEQNSPNPFNQFTTIRFSLPNVGSVSLSIYDLNGRLVRTLMDNALVAGQHEIVWDGTDASGRPVASGTYLYRLTSAKGTVMRKMTLVR